jgi:predicted AAA+ superfamily ATPase
LSAGYPIDRGKVLENVVFLELRRRYRKVYYWKGSKEVDFVAETQDGLTPYQVTRPLIFSASGARVASSIGAASVKVPT